MQLEIGMSMSRYLPATGTAGLDRDLRERVEPRAAAAAEDEARTLRMAKGLGKQRAEHGRQREWRCPDVTMLTPRQR